MWTHWWRSASEHYVINSLPPIKLCIDPLSPHKSFGLFHSSNAACWSYILLILARPAAYFPRVFKCNFMCELVVARLWKTDILTVHRYVCVCVASSIHKHTNQHECKQNTYTVNACFCLHFYDVLFKVCCSALDLKELTLADIQRLHQRNPYK